MCVCVRASLAAATTLTHLTHLLLSLLNLRRISSQFVIVDALCKVVSSPIDEKHKDQRNTCMMVMSNMGITKECKKGLHDWQDGRLLNTLLSVIEAGDKNENNVLAIEKALVVCKNMSNHPDTKKPMFENPRLIPLMLNLINNTEPKSKAHREVALQVFQNLANNDKTPMRMLEYESLIESVAKVIAEEGDNDVARRNACLTLQNISFIEECREPLFRFEGVFGALSGICDVVNDDLKKNALPVCLNISLAKNVRVEMLNHPTWIQSLMNIASGEQGVTREKALR